METKQRIHVDANVDIGKVTKKIIIVYQNNLQCLVSDLITFATVISVIGMGVLLKSDAMQWVGAFMFFLILLGKIHMNNGGINTRTTIDEAIIWLKTLKETP